jgi:hypothetical protein
MSERYIIVQSVDHDGYTVLDQATGFTSIVHAGWHAAAEECAKLREAEKA